MGPEDEVDQEAHLPEDHGGEDNAAGWKKVEPKKIPKNATYSEVLKSSGATTRTVRKVETAVDVGLVDYEGKGHLRKPGSGTATAAWCSGAKEDAGSAASFLRALAAAVLPRRGLVYNIFVLKGAVF